MSTPFEDYSVGTIIKSESIFTDDWELDGTTKDSSEFSINKSDGNSEWDSDYSSQFDSDVKPTSGELTSDKSNTKPLSCWVCKVLFSDYSSFVVHHIQHITQPCVLLPDFSDIISGKAPSSDKANPENTSTDKDRSPLKITFKKLTNEKAESKFEVVNRKKKGNQGGRKSSKMEVEGNNQGEEGESPSSNTNVPSPTPSEFLRPTGLLAPESNAPSPDNNEDLNGDKPESNDYPSSPPELTREDVESSLPSPGDANSSPNNDEHVRENGLEESNNDEENNIDSGIECEKDGFPNFDSSENAMPLPSSSSAPSASTGCGLTVLAPSQVNSNAVVNGSLLSEQAENNVVSEAFNALGGLANTEVREGLSVLSPAKLFNNGSNLMDTNDPLSLLHNYMDPQTNNSMEFMPLDRLGGETCEVCGERTMDRELMQQHKAAMGHFKCHVSPDCAVVLFGSATELSNHQQVTHGLMPTPPPMQQLAQQVQRMSVPYGEMGTPPQSASPGYQNRNSPLYRVTPPVHMQYPQQASPSGFNINNGSSPYQALQMGSQPQLSMSPVSQKRPGSVESCEGSAPKRRNDDPDCSVVSVQPQPVNIPTLPGGITLSVRGQQAQQQIPAQPQSGKKSDASSVANILANRGITVTPTGNRGGVTVQPTVTSPRRNQQQAQVTAVPQPVTTLNLSSAISITPASQAARQNQFAVPQGRSMGRQQAPANAVRLPTVDLTQDTPPVRNRNRMARFTCQVCDKVFSTQDSLNQHMMTHRSPTKLPFRCTLCNAQYPTQQGLQQHKMTYHRETASSEMAIPIVDLKQPGVIQKLTSIGIRQVIPLSQLINNGDGMFGLPIIAIDNARNPAMCNLGRLGASNVFSIGPVKSVR